MAETKAVHLDGGSKADFVDFEEKFPGEFADKDPTISKPGITKLSGPMQDVKRG
jgi:hypothetical protein